MWACCVVIVFTVRVVKYVAVCLDVVDDGRRRETFIIHLMGVEGIWIISSEVAGRSVYGN